MKDNKELFRKLSALGYSLLEPEELQDVNSVLADVVKSGDSRLWEGFPVVLAKSAEKGLFNYNDVNKRLNLQDRTYLVLLTAMSLALYRSLGLKFAWASAFRSDLSTEWKKTYDNFLKKLKDGEDLEVGAHVMTSQRLKSVFNNYFVRTKSDLEDLLSTKDEMELEYALSHVFSAKQRELFLRKLKGDRLNKTDNEYYSRVVRKKVAALANSELHRLAQKVL